MNTMRKEERELLRLFGEHVRMLRISKGLSQEDLADKAGLHRTYIGMVERAEKNITIVSMRRIADSLGVSLKDLVDLKPTNGNSTVKR